MKAWSVDDALYVVFDIEVSEDFEFEGQYDVWKFKHEAELELRKRVKADIQYLQEILEDL